MANGKTQSRAKWSLWAWLDYHIERRRLEKLYKIGTRQCRQQYWRRRHKLEAKYGRAVR